MERACREEKMHGVCRAASCQPAAAGGSLFEQHHLLSEKSKPLIKYNQIYV